MERLRTGVIGLGRMGQHHCRVYASQRESQLVGVYDVNTQKAEEISTRYEVPSFARVEDLLAQVDAVTIATPTPTHFALASLCLEHNVHILIEKPITESLDEAQELIRAIQNSGLIVQIGHIERFNPTYIELKKVIDGLKLIAIDFRRLSPYRVSNIDVDVVLDLMVHDLDLSFDLLGKTPVHINAYGLTPFSGSLDHVAAQLCYCDGPLITLTASRVTEQKIRTVVVTTQDAFIEADFLNKGISVHRCSTGEYTAQNQNGVKYRQESVIERILVPSVEPLALEIQHFLKCIVNKCTPSVPANDGVRALSLALQISHLVNEQSFSMVA